MVECFCFCLHGSCCCPCWLCRSCCCSSCFSYGSVADIWQLLLSGWISKSIPQIYFCEMSWDICAALSHNDFHKKYQRLKIELWKVHFDKNSRILLIFIWNSHSTTGHHWITTEFAKRAQEFQMIFERKNGPLRRIRGPSRKAHWEVSRDSVSPHSCHCGIVIALIMTPRVR